MKNTSHCMMEFRMNMRKIVQKVAKYLYTMTISLKVSYIHRRVCESCVYIHKKSVWSV